MLIPVIQDLQRRVSDALSDDSLRKLKGIGVFHQSLPDDMSEAASEAVCLVDGHIGLASWCLNPLYTEARRCLKQDKGDIRAANVILAINPDFLSAWNLRKERMGSERLTLELKFSELILSRSPKSAETWSHRAWLLRKFGCDDAQLATELDLSWRASSRAPHNYFAGVHRLRLMPRMSCELALQELQRGRKWLQSHVGDSSGWWYHRALLLRLEDFAEAPSDHDDTVWFSDMWARYGKKYQNIAQFKKFSATETNSVQESMM